MAPDKGEEHGVKSNFARLVIHFVKDKLLPAWSNGSDVSADANIKGTAVDRLCLDWAAQFGVPLISWEGWGPKGLDSTAFIPSEAKKRGIDHVSPEELLTRERFSGTEEAKRFFSGWDRLAPGYVAENPSAKETMEHFRHYYHRLAANDWTA